MAVIVTVLLLWWSCRSRGDSYGFYVFEYDVSECDVSNVVM
jgi:hypothetical protein